jgi:hypothetical protein
MWFALDGMSACRWSWSALAGLRNVVRALRRVGEGEGGVGFLREVVLADGRVAFRDLGILIAVPLRCCCFEEGFPELQAKGQLVPLSCSSSSLPRLTLTDS